MSFIRIIRPELTERSLRLFTREYNYLADVYDETDPYELTSILVDLALDSLNLDHIRLEDNKYIQDIRLLLFRSMYFFFKQELKNEYIDLLIAEIFL